MRNVGNLMFSEGGRALKQIIDVLSGRLGKRWLKALNEFVNQGAVKAFGWKTYGPAKLKSYESAEVMIAAVKATFKSSNKYRGDQRRIEKLVAQFKFPLEEETVEFIALRVDELGFEIGSSDEGVKVSEIKECLSKLGLEMCKDSDGPRIFLADNGSINNLKSMRGGVITSEPILYTSPEASIEEADVYLFVIIFDNPNNYENMELNVVSRKDRDEEGKFPCEPEFRPWHKIILRVKSKK